MMVVKYTYTQKKEKREINYQNKHTENPGFSIPQARYFLRNYVESEIVPSRLKKKFRRTTSENNVSTTLI